MRITTKLFLLIGFIFIQISAYSQFTYVIADSIKVSENGILMDAALAGGFNAPQFNEIDLNGDGKLDLVVFDRAGEKFVTYLNEGSQGVVRYKYAPKYINIFPKSYDWVKLIDYDCDGLVDMFRGDGSSGVVAHKNIGSLGNNRFRAAEILFVKGSSIFPQNLNSTKTDIPGIADIDGDGDIDFLTFGATQLNYQKNVSMDSLGICGLKFEYRNYCWGRFTESNVDEQLFLDSCGYNNINNPEITDGTKGTSANTDKHSGSTVTLYDFDNQNGMDLLLGDISSTSVKRLINGDQSPGFKSSHIVSYDGIYPPDSLNRNNIPTFPATYIMDFNNDGNKDLILTVNTDDVSALNAKNTRLFLNTGTLGNPKFEYVKSDFLQDEILDFGKDALPTFFDYNSDGLMDIVVGNNFYRDDSSNTAGRLALLKNVGTQNNPRFELIDRNYLQIDTLPLLGFGNRAINRLSTAFGDLDADGDVDMLIGDDTGKLHYFENIAGIGAVADFRLAEKNYQKIEVGENANPRIIDLDKDGKVDLVVGERLGNLNFFKNRGTNAAPIFNLKIDSIVWEGNFIFKYYIEGNPDLSGLTINDRYEITETSIPANKGFLYLTGVNQASNYLTFRNYIIDSDTINESGNGYINVSYDSIGNVRSAIYENQNKPSNNSQPLFYEYQGKLQLLSPSNNGKLKAFTDIDSNIYGSFTFTQDNALDLNIGYNLSGDVFDLNNDGKVDLVLGNQSGGITIFYGDGFVGIDNDHTTFESSTKMQLKIFPNPTKGEFNLLLSDFEEGKAYQVKVFDLVGKLVFEKTILQEIEQLDLSQQNKGVYFIQLQSDGKVSKAKKLIIH
jgi:hypothetical protein